MHDTAPCTEIFWKSNIGKEIEKHPNSKISPSAQEKSCSRNLKSLLLFFPFLSNSTFSYFPLSCSHPLFSSFFPSWPSQLHPLFNTNFHNFFKCLLSATSSCFYSSMAKFFFRNFSLFLLHIYFFSLSLTSQAPFLQYHVWVLESRTRNQFDTNGQS